MKTWLLPPSRACPPMAVNSNSRSGARRSLLHVPHARVDYLIPSAGHGGWIAPWLWLLRWRQLDCRKTRGSKCMSWSPERSEFSFQSIDAARARPPRGERVGALRECKRVIRLRCGAPSDRPRPHSPPQATLCYSGIRLQRHQQRCLQCNRSKESEVAR